MKQLRTVLSIVLVLAALLSLFSCSAEKAGETGSLPEGFEKSDETSNYVCIQMNTGKNIILELYPDIAPKTVANFQKLVGKGFYDGLIFHRVISGFMIQGGDPDGNGTGGPGWTIEGEFASNGFQNNLKHERGVISMARSQSPNSAGSQFFIMHEAAAHLDGLYAAFGKVIHGLDVVDEIAGCKVAGETPVTKQVMEKVYFLTKNGSVGTVPASTEEKKSETAETEEEKKTEEKAPPQIIVPTGYTRSEEKTDTVCIQMKAGGHILVALSTEAAPLTVSNFKSLVSKGFYDGLTFHRVMSGFMIQGGDPDGDGTGGPGWTIDGEFAENGYVNEKQPSHVRGVISMARKTAPNSAGSQFFIMHADATYLDGKYASFGKVIEGMDVVDRIASCEVSGETPKEAQVIEAVYFVTKAEA